MNAYVACEIVYASIIGMLLIVSGNVELNPADGPLKKCPQCESSVGTRTKKCGCGHTFIMKCKRNHAGVV